MIAAPIEKKDNWSKTITTTKEVPADILEVLDSKNAVYQLYNFGGKLLATVYGKQALADIVAGLNSKGYSPLKATVLLPQSALDFFDSADITLYKN